MLEDLLNALANLMTFQHIGFMLLGVTLGLIVGVLPGLGGIVGLSLLLPFVYGIEPSLALALLIGLVAVVPTSDTFASVLMGIPGSTASQATVIDGFALSRKGEAARALAAAFSASLFGGLFGAVILTGFVVVARPFILAFGTAELFALTIFGLSMVGVLSGNNLAKGLGAAALGLTLGSIGAAPATGEYRLDLGTIYLTDGLPLVIVALGLFAVPEIVDLLRGQSQIARTAHLGQGWAKGLRDTWANKWLTLRCSSLGAVMGAIPGLGGAVVDWVAYGHVVQTSRVKSQFGQGDIRGVIAPESANNAKEGGALIPTVLFGIPGSGSMAVFLAGLILIGIQPGPNMATRNVDITYTIVWSLAFANVMGTVLCIAAAPAVARLTTIRYSLIAPFMIMVISFASFQATRSLNDLIALLVIGILGVFLKRFGWSRPAFLIGFVLSTQVERYLYQAIQFTGWSFVTRPLVIGIIVVTLISVVLGARSNFGGKPGAVNTEGNGAAVSWDRLWPQILFGALFLAIFAIAIWDSLGVSYLGRVFPFGVAVFGIAITLFALFPLAAGRTKSSANFDAEGVPRDSDVAGGAWAMIGWLAGFVALVSLVGFVIALVIFFVAFLKTIARASWLQTLVLSVAATGGILILSSALNLIFPSGLLQTVWRLPWPYG